MAEFSFELDYCGKSLRFDAESIFNEILNEAYYCVTLEGYPSFVMAWDLERGRLIRQGAAPYFVYELEESVGRKIEEFNLI